MKYLPVFLICWLNLSAAAQAIPDSVTYSPEKFADHLRQHHSTAASQVRGLYSWITSNIQYDKDSALYINWSTDYAGKISATLRRRKGVCENFAALFADISRRLGLRSYVVYGYPAWADKNKDNSHGWVAIELDGKWFLCDPTWDAGAASEKYYMSSPSDFIQTHIPFDPIWQLLDRPKNYNDAGLKFNYQDSINSYLQLDSLQQYQATERRIKNGTLQNTMTKNWQQFNRMNIAVISGEEDMKHYNAAVEAVNEANGFLNAFIQFRNQQFTPNKTDEQLGLMLSPIGNLLKKAEAHLLQLGKNTENFQYDPATIRQRILSLYTKTDQQNLFLHQYFTTPTGERIKLFYK
ncbi:MAG: hypothetical protein EOO45_26535 [Flavobacterium sp.]|nr:MAG: hypothetical protein EOO45_26535 [Flavobacterium sp.]